MAKPLRPKRGTTAKNDAFTGLASEITIDTEKHSIRVHDGVTAGGHALATEADLATVRVTAEAALPKDGGEITGTVVFDRADGHIYKKDASGRMIIRGGTSSATDGASIYLNGKDSVNDPSAFQVRCADGTNDKSLVCKPDGTITWGGQNVLVNTTGAIIIDGKLRFTQPLVIDQATSTSYTTIRGGSSNSDGARLVLTSMGDSDKGQFKVYAHDGTNSAYLQGLPDGTLTWKGKNIVRSVNGTAADASGNVTLSVSSGTVTKKFESGKKSINSNSSTTVSITGLTANKPLYIICKSNSQTYVGITSGAVYTNNTTAAGILSSWDNDPATAVIIPTGTSVGLRLRNNTDSAASAYLIAYQ